MPADLLSGFNLCGHILRNRLGVAPMTRMSSVADPEVSLFKTKAEWQGLIQLLAAESIDAVSVSTYDFRAPGFDSDLTVAQLTRAVTDLPLMICGKIHDRDSAQAALEHADIVLAAKSFLLNPNFVADVREGKALPLHKSSEANVAYTPTPLP